MSKICCRAARYSGLVCGGHAHVLYTCTHTHAHTHTRTHARTHTHTHTENVLTPSFSGFTLFWPCLPDGDGFVASSLAFYSVCCSILTFDADAPDSTLFSISPIGFFLSSFSVNWYNFSKINCF